MWVEKMGYTQTKSPFLSICDLITHILERRAIPPYGENVNRRRKIKSELMDKTKTKIRPLRLARQTCRIDSIELWGFGSNLEYTQRNSSPEVFMIICNGLTKVFKIGPKHKEDFAAVENLSLEIPQGQVFGFLGPN